MVKSERNSGPLSGKQHTLLVSRLASELQKSINTGLASTKIMKQIDELVKSNLERKMKGILRKLDRLLSSNSTSKFGDSIGLLYVKIVSLQELIRSGDEGYTLSCSPKGRVKTSVIKDLLKLDEEIAYFSNALYNSIPQKNTLKDDTLREVENIVEDLYHLLSKRQQFLAAMKKAARG
ncbi:MAG: hypothetical protein QXW32_01495 [Nitrososphaerales archaeon]